MNDPSTCAISVEPATIAATVNGSWTVNRSASTTTADRRGEIDAKQAIIAGLLQEAHADALFLFDPANLAWFSGSALCSGIADASEWPAIFLTDNQRWLVGGSADTQRLFDLHLDRLGFQLKEWPWHWGRERLLSDLVQNRKIACDRVLAESIPFGPTLRRLRLALTPGERLRLADLGAAVAHALEATCRNLEPGESEEDVAGQIAHRLLKHGIAPAVIHVAADGRTRRHPRPGISTARIVHECAVFAVGQRFGLHAGAARSVHFGPLSEKRRAEFDAALAISGGLASASRPGVTIVDALEFARRIAEVRAVELDWTRQPTGHVTGWLPVERPITPTANFALDVNWIVTWRPSVGGSLVADSWVIGERRAAVTPPDGWPIRRVHVDAETFDLPDLLVR